MEAGAMAAVMKITPQEVAALCEEIDGYIVPTNYNSPEQTVVSGETAAVEKFLLLAKKRKIRALKLPVSAPFHCELMAPAKAALEKVFQGVAFSDAALPLYMNVDGKPHRKAEDIQNCVLLQTISPVRWTDTIYYMAQDGIDEFIELGTGHTLQNFVKKIVPNRKTACVQDAESLCKIVAEYSVDSDEKESNAFGGANDESNGPDR